MDTKRLITMMLISFAVIFGWQIFVHQVLYPRHPEWRRPGQPPVTATSTTQPAPTTAAAAATTQASPTTQLAATTPTTAPIALPTASVVATAPAIAAGPPPAVRVVAAATQPTVVTLGEEAAFPMIVRVSSAGAGLESVTLKEF